VSGLGAINGSFTLASGGKLTPTGTTGVLTLNNNLTLSGGTCVINMDAGLSQNALITMNGTGALTLNSGTIQLNITDGALANNTYKLIAVPNGTIAGSVGAIAVSGFVQSDQAATLVVNPSGGGGYELDLHVYSYVPQSLEWLGDGAGVGAWNTGSGADTDWNDLTSSTSGVAFNTTDNTTFDDTSANTTVNLSGALTPSSVTVNGAGTQNYTFQGGGSIGGVATLTDNAASTTGPLTILTVNSYSGVTTIASGATIQVGNGTTAGSLGIGPVANSGTLVFDLPAGASESMGAASGTGTLTMASAATGTLVLNGADTLGGLTTVTSGTLKQGAANLLPNGAGVGNIVVNGTLDLGGQSGTVNSLSGTGTINSSSAGTAVLTVTGGGTFGGVIENTATSLGLTFNATGQELVLTGVNTYSGGTTVTAGTLQMGGVSAIPSLAGDVTVSSGGTLDINGFSPTIGALNGGGTIDNISSANTGSYTLTIDNTGDNGTFSGAIQDTTGTINLYKAGAGTQILTGASTYSGTTTINGGVLQLNAGGSINGGAINTTDTGGQLLINGGSVTASAASNIGIGSINGLWLEAGSATFNGGLTTDLGQNSTILIQVTGGTLTASSIQLGRTGQNNGTTVPTSGVTTEGLYINGGTAVVNVTGVLHVGDNSTTIASDANLRIDSGTLTAASIYIGVDNLRYSVFDENGGTVTISTLPGINIGGTYTGDEIFLMRAGTASTPAITMGQTGDGGGSYVFSQTGGTLYVGSGGMVLGGGTGTYSNFLGGGILAASAPWTSSLSNYLGGTPTIQAANSSGAAENITLSGVLLGTPTSLTVTGAGTLTLSGVNSFNTPIVITGGNLAIGGAGQLNTGAYSGAITENGTFTYGSSVAQTLSGAISGSGGLNQNGPGTLTLAAADSYNGATTISAGTLALGAGGSIANSSVSLAGGATFDVSAVSTAAAPYNMAGASFTASGDAPAVLNIASAGYVTNTLPTTLILTPVASAVPNPALTVAQGTLVLSNNQFTINGPLLPPGIYTVANTSGTGAISFNSTWGDNFPAPTGTAIGWPGTTAPTITVSGSGSSAVLALTISDPNSCVGGLVATNGTWTRAYSSVDANDEQLSFGNTNGIYSVVGYNMVNCTFTSGTATVYGGGTVAVGPGTPYLIGLNAGSSTSGTPTVLPVGTTNLVLIATQTTQGVGQTARVNALVVADGCSANTMSFDPISANLYLSQSGEVRIVFNNISQNDKYVSLQNGVPGLRSARILVNGTVFALNGLADGASRSVDISGALKGGTGNTVVVEGFGAKGGGAVVSIGETPAAPASGNFQVTAASAVSTFINLPALQITQSGDQTVLSWPATGPAGEDFTAYQLQTSASGLPGSWSAAGTAPVSAGGQLTVTVTAGGSGQFYQLANPAAQ
jgi:autotransporter-associated beta strand protein